MRTYNIINKQYRKAENIESNCNAISFTNNGTEPAYINDEILAAGATISINGLEGEKDTTNYALIFGTGGGTQLIDVKRKLYI